MTLLSSTSAVYRMPCMFAHQGSANFSHLCSLCLYTHYIPLGFHGIVHIYDASSISVEHGVMNMKGSLPPRRDLHIFTRDDDERQYTESHSDSYRFLRRKLWTNLEQRRVFSLYFCLW